jgi:hypothetical protein
MNQKAELKAAISLNRSAFSRGLRETGAEAANWARGVARSTGSILSSVAKVGIGAGIAGGIAGAAGIGKSIKEAMDLETISVQFEQLLGSASKAKARIAELIDFAAKTPFELPEITRASKMLQTMTGNALSMGQGLRLVGDVAAMSGRPFEEMAMHIGRLYDGLKNNRPVGESLMRLSEVGAISGELRGKIEDLVAAGNGKMAWDAAAAGLGRFSGAMDKLSATLGGLFSTLRDGVNALFRAVGEPIIQELKPIIMGITKFAEGLEPKARAFGKAFADGIKIGVQMFKDGSLIGFLKDSAIAALADIGNKAMGIATSTTVFLGNAMATALVPFTKGLVTSALAFGYFLTSGIASGLETMQEDIYKALGKKGDEMVAGAWAPFKPMAMISKGLFFDPLRENFNTGLFGETSPMGSAARFNEEMGQGLMHQTIKSLGEGAAALQASLERGAMAYKETSTFDNYKTPAQMSAQLALVRAQQGIDANTPSAKQLALENLVNVFADAFGKPEDRWGSSSAQAIEKNATEINQTLQRLLGLTPAN